MIKKVRIVRFKGFEDEIFDLSGQTIMLAGPNNSGKTTLLHAISVWNLALRLWQNEIGENGRTKRISIVLDEFTALPLREMNLLWLNRHTAKKPSADSTPKQAPIYIQVEVESLLGTESLTMEIIYGSQKLVYARPVQSPDNPSPLSTLPEFVSNIKIVHIPSFSGIETSEPLHSEGIRDKLIGEGRAGEIVRNLVLDIWNESKHNENNKPWKDLSDSISKLFQYEILPPVHGLKQTYIMCEYRPPTLGGNKRGPKLDIANAGSGFHQTLLLLAFFYARPSSVLLVDEPDAHLHFILQREICDYLRSVASRRGCQLILTTHAEALLKEAEPEQILSFVGKRPRRLLTPQQKSDLTEALHSLKSLDLLQADHVGAVLYVENESDYKLLREWAIVLNHTTKSFLSFPFIFSLQGNDLGRAKKHFRCIALVRPEIKALCILDRDLHKGPEATDLPPGMTIHRWQRYEIENYLLNPTILLRYLDSELDLFSASVLEKDTAIIENAFLQNFPSGIDYLSEVQSLGDIKASEFLVKVLGATSRPLPKRDLFILARLYRSTEIHNDVIQALNRLQDILPNTSPSDIANATSDDPEGLEEDNTRDESTP